jgi:hypothetical protein
MNRNERNVLLLTNREDVCSFRAISTINQKELQVSIDRIRGMTALQFIGLFKRWSLDFLRGSWSLFDDVANI